MGIYYMASYSKFDFLNRIAATACILFLLMFCHFNALSAVQDSVKKKEKKVIPVIKAIDENAFFHADPTKELKRIDSLLEGIEIFNPAFKRSNHYLGNLGTATAPSIFDINKNFLADIGFHGYDLYFDTPEKLKYYRTNTPFSELNYNLCSKSEQSLRIRHTQNVSERFNFGLDYNRLGSDGYFLHQMTSINHFDFVAWYNSKNQRYNVLVNGVWNIVKNQENGGIASDSTFDASYVNNLNRGTMHVNLMNAQRRYRNRTFYVKQFYDLGYHYNVNINDSTSVEKFKPAQRIAHTISLETGSNTFVDSLETAGFYAKFYPDTLSIFDSSHYSKLENKLSWSTLSNKKNQNDSVRHLNFSVEVAHQLIRYNQKSIDTAMQNIYAGFSLFNNPENNDFRWSVDGKYNFFGVNKGLYSTEIKLSKSVDEFFFHVDAGRKLLAPQLIQNRYDGSNFQWINHFKNSENTYASFSVINKMRKLKLAINYFEIRNQIYFDTLALPAQSAGTVRVQQVVLTKNFVWNRFHLNNDFTFQKISGDDVLHLPQFLSVNSFYYETYLFKHVLQTQFGTDFHYYSSYRSDAYMPVTGQFYLQNSIKTGNYPIVDLFISFRIRTARIFIRGENLLDGFLPVTGYYLVPQYPMPGSSLKFGIIWQFFD